MSLATNPIPPGFVTVTPHLRVRGGKTAIEFYGRAFGAELLSRVSGPDGESVLHAVLQIGDSRLMVSDEFPQWGANSPLSIGGTGMCVHLYVADTDTAVNRATAAGAKLIMPAADMFWGDRYAKLLDPFGHEWSIASHIEDLTSDQVHHRAKAAFCGKRCD